MGIYGIIRNNKGGKMSRKIIQTAHISVEKPAELYQSVDSHLASLLEYGQELIDIKYSSTACFNPNAERQYSVIREYSALIIYYHIEE